MCGIMAVIILAHSSGKKKETNNKAFPKPL